MARKMIKCFMNGKSCIYERVIDENLSRSNRDKKAFILMPYNPHLDTLYQWEIFPFIKNGGGGKGEEKYKCHPERADDVRRVGFIICEKICKKIQEADLIVADVSYDNPNVFYELGISVALRKDILPICVEDYAKKRETELRRLFGIEKLLSYKKFDMLEDRISEYIMDFSRYDDAEHLSGNYIRILHDGRIVSASPENLSEINYEFGALCRTAVGDAIQRIFSHENLIKKRELELYSDQEKGQLRDVKDLNLKQKSNKLEEIIKHIKESACVLIDITSNSIANFFWLGYLHGIGGNVIPINSISSKEEGKYKIAPFDVRALWHIVFKEGEPFTLSSSLTEILEFILTEKARYLYRQRFWANILKDNKVSIFLGSLYNKELGRNTIGDWDYRTAAEITSYLSSSKETMKVTLESPLPKREQNPDSDYIIWLKNQMIDKNCIIVASADVNDLTEIALSEILGKEPFKKIYDNDLDFQGYIAYKMYTGDKEAPDFPETAFYRREVGKKEDRGFIIKEGMTDHKFTKEHSYPSDDVAGLRILLGQLVVARNPLSKDKWVIVISGISGPATLGIAQLLTGCMYSEFTINDSERLAKENGVLIKTAISEYTSASGLKESHIHVEENRIDHGALSEELLAKLLEVSDTNETNSIVGVGVYYPEDQDYSNDERKIIAWYFPELTTIVGHQWDNPSKLHINRRSS